MALGQGCTYCGCQEKEGHLQGPGRTQGRFPWLIRCPLFRWQNHIDPDVYHQLLGIRENQQIIDAKMKGTTPSGLGAIQLLTTWQGVDVDIDILLIIFLR